jgi:hypothetical protein
MKQNDLIDRLLSEDKVRDVDYPAMAAALPDADYVLTWDGNGRGRTWYNRSVDDMFTVRDKGPGIPMWGDEIDRVARHLRAAQARGAFDAPIDTGRAEEAGRGDAAAVEPDV